MRSRSLTDFMFVGMAVVPGVLVWFDQLGPAIMVFVPMLVAACLCGWYEQVTDIEDEQAQRPER